MAAHILIAEDDALQASVLKNALERRGYRTEIVTNGLEAVRQLRTGHYDLGLLDYHMPDIDGLAAARLLQDLLTAERRPHLIAMTSAPDELCEREFAGGRCFDAVVSKRLGLNALFSVIESRLSSTAPDPSAEAAKATFAQIQALLAKLPTQQARADLREQLIHALRVPAGMDLSKPEPAKTHPISLDIEFARCLTTPASPEAGFKGLSLRS